jgi:cobalamin-dependent methionine synthase I
MVQPEDAERSILLACFADEDHALPAVGVGIRLASWGWRVVEMGARTPPEALQHAVEELHPDAVGLSCTVAPPRARAVELLDAYAAACGSTPWLVGGEAAQQLAPLVQSRGGAITGGDATAVRRALEHALASRTRVGSRNLPRPS